MRLSKPTPLQSKSMPLAGVRRLHLAPIRGDLYDHGVERRNARASVRLFLALLALAVPGAASAQVDIDGNKLTTEVRVGQEGYSDSRDRSVNVGYLTVVRR